MTAHMVERSRCGMPSSPSECSHRQTTSFQACHHRPCYPHTIGRRQAWHSDEGGSEIPSSSLGSTRGRKTSSMTCHLCNWTAHMTTFGVAVHHCPWIAYTGSDGIGRGMPSSPLDSTWSQDVERSMVSLPLDSTHGWTTLGASTLSSSLGSTHGRMTSSIKCHHCPWRHTRSDYVREQTRTIDIRRGMPAWPLVIPHGRMMSGVECHHRPWKAYNVERRWGWHAIITLGQHTRSDDVGRGMTSLPLRNTSGRMMSCLHTRSHNVDVECHNHPFAAHAVGRRRTMSGVACHHRPWAAHTVGQRLGVASHHRPWKAYTIGQCRAWHVIIAFEQHAGLENVVRGIPAWPLGITQEDVGRGMPLSPLCSTHIQTMSGVTYHNRPSEAHRTTQMVGRHRAWYFIIAIGKNTQLDYICRGMPSWPLESTHGRTTSGVADHHRLWTSYIGSDDFGALKHTRLDNVEHGLPSSLLHSIHGQTTSGIACHHRYWEAHAVEPRQHRRSDDVGHEMSSSPLDNRNGGTTSAEHAIIALGQHK
ncbi:hypothetical protein EJD97_001925 [Solanum chilense]|uniref:Uncharacterized protein n=1 Tax=Solanum chilense TaxID=4083 RepID=A0A6N2AQ93_SOLCI|nr:hypothetical protein EJD97_001925 [Solanum chilense]